MGYARLGLSSHAPVRNATAMTPGTTANRKLLVAKAPALAQVIEQSASAKVAMRDET